MFHARASSSRPPLSEQSKCKGQNYMPVGATDSWLLRPKLPAQSLERHWLKCARNLHPATGEEPRVRFDIPFGGNRTFSVRLKIALSGSLGQAVTIAVARRDRSVPEVMAFQT